MNRVKQRHSGRKPAPVRPSSTPFVAPSRQTESAVVEPSFVSPVVQPKFSISQPGDALELEADTTADRVMRMTSPSTGATPPDDPTDTPILPKRHDNVTVMPKCAACEEDEKEKPDVQAKEQSGGLADFFSIMRQPLEEEDERPNLIQAKPMAGVTHLMLKCSHCEEEERQQQGVHRKPNSDGPAAGFRLDSYLQNSRSGGEPMDRTTQSFMESRFGADLSGVRIHSGSQAGQASEAIRARAFTHGQSIHFNRGEYQPQTDSGRWLLAHELTHTLQQGSSSVRPIMRKAKPDEPAFYVDIMGGKEAYAVAKTANLDSWYEGYKFFNLFLEEEIYPGSHPNAYATRVYELQEKLHLYYGEKFPKENITGMLEPSFLTSPTLNALLGVAANYVKQNGDAKATEAGFNVDMLKRINRLNTSFDPKAPPLESRLLQGVPQLNMVNSSPNFTIGKGDRGFYVSLIQSALLQLNYSLGKDYVLAKGQTEKTVTGIFGDDTRKAVEQFQIDSGMEGKDVDGVVGQITLRLLDRRLEKRVRTNLSYDLANVIGVMVPVTEADIPTDASKAEEIKRSMLIRSIMTAMPLSQKEAENLLASGWKWQNYRDVNRNDVAKGYIVNAITKEDYEKIMGKPKGSTGGITAQQLSEQIVDQALELQTTTDLYQLNKEVKALQDERDSVQSIISMHEKYVPQSLYDQLHSLNRRLTAKIEARDRELKRLGYKSMDEYTARNEQFVKTFLQYAAMIAFQMLSRNEAKASVEYQHYENPDEIKALKDTITQLNTYYANSETYLMQGVSYEETNGADTNKYKTRSDYVLANEYCDDMGCNGAAYEAILKSRWEANVKEKSTKNQYYAKLFDEEATAFKYLKENSERFPILGNPKFNVRDKGPAYVKKPDTSLRDDIKEIIGTRTSGDGIMQNIANTRERIRGDVELLWEMPPVIAQAKAELGIIDGTVLDNIITDAYKAHQDKGFWSTVFKAALGIGLGLLALVSGPIGWIALGASIAYGAYDAYQTYQDIKMKREASETAVDEEAMALMHEKPSYFWFVVSLVGVGLDALQAVKVMKAIGQGIELAETAQKGIRAEIAASELEKSALKEGSKEAVAISRRIERLNKALTEIDWVQYTKHGEILKFLKDSPFAMRFMADALKESGLAKAFTKLTKLGLSEDLMKTVVGMYAGVGKKAVGEFPEVMRLIESGKLAGNSTLVKTLLTDLKAQRALLDSGDPAKIASLFAEWEGKSGSKALSFAEHLAQQGMNTTFRKGIVLTERYGPEFAEMSNLLKNKLILREIEPSLVGALNAKRLPPAVQRSLEVTLQRDVLGLTNDLGIAQERMMKQLSALGETLQFQSEYLAVTSLLQNSRSRKVLWEAAVNLPGRADYLKIMDEVAKANPDKMGKIMDDLIRIGPLTDKATLERLVADDVLRKTLADNPLAVLALKKCASPCFPPALTPDQIPRLTKVMSGKTGDEITKINNLIYQSRATKDTLEVAIRNLETNFDEAIKAVKSIDVAFPKGLNVTENMRTMANVLVSMGLPPDQVSNIIKNVVRHGGTSSSRVENLLDSMSRILKLKNLNVVLGGLESSDKSLFKTAEFLVDEIVSHTNPSDLDKVQGILKYPGLLKTDSLLSNFTLAELRDLRTALSNQTEFVNNLYYVTQKVSGTKTEWISVIKQAGTGGKTDIERMIAVLESQTGKLTYQQAIDTIAKSKAFAGEVAKAMDDPVHGYQSLAKLIWEVPDDVAKNLKAGDAISVPQKFIDSGSAAYTQVIKTHGVDLANKMLSGNTVDYSRWKVVKSIIEKSNIDNSIKNGIIGDLWEIVHGQAYRKMDFDFVLTDVKLTDGTEHIFADIVAVKGNQVYIVELKSMGATLSTGQAKIYPLLRSDKIKTLKFSTNPKLDAIFAANLDKVSFNMIEEAVVAP
ncbi:DUF4157 domain-containing protein [Spirosoma taeanense]|uniref:DUF4157 domain-containing protein n=1 Tax=Spirosoma taeanense TaxID=2735870 RepID=A0A6M5Y7Q7_9BACT|nr:DUF4157 domain-containing protein [Spirosoma taeanense]QJW89143.1 DUF4157 domain-containing protein [Spirosoma taeanense]